MAEVTVLHGWYVWDAGLACARASYSYIWGSRRIFSLLGRLAWSIGNYSSQAAFRMRFILFAPRWPLGSERNRLVGKKEQCGPGLSCQQTIPPRHHSGSRSVWRRFVPATGRNASGLLRQAIVYCMLDFVEGRPRAGWKIWPGCALCQNTPTRFAQFFSLAFFLSQSPLGPCADKPDSHNLYSHPADKYIPVHTPQD